jgi:REP element-mobilizing transposase RayT
MAARAPSTTTATMRLLAENCRAAKVEVWAWCLMPNHVHLILVPSDPADCLLVF